MIVAGSFDSLYCLFSQYDRDRQDGDGKRLEWLHMMKTSYVVPQCPTGRKTQNPTTQMSLTSAAGQGFGVLGSVFHGAFHGLALPRRSSVVTGHRGESNVSSLGPSSLASM